MPSGIVVYILAFVIVVILMHIFIPDSVLGIPDEEPTKSDTTGDDDTV